MIKKIKLMVVAIVAAAGCLTGITSNVSKDNLYVSPLSMVNVEALSRSEIEVVGCYKADGCTCYVFSNGNLIDKQKNKSPKN